VWQHRADAARTQAGGVERSTKEIKDFVRARNTANADRFAANVLPVIEQIKARGQRHDVPSQGA
jgi:hypothetical protein